MSKDKKIVWTHYFSRKFCSQRFEIVIRVFISDFYRKRFHASLQNNLVAPERGNHTIYYENAEWQRFTKKVYYGTCKNLPTFHYYMQLVRRWQVRYGSGAQKLANGNLTKLSWRELRRRYLAFDRLHLDFFNGPIWVPFITEPFISQVAEQELQKLLRQHQRVSDTEEIVEIIFSPEKKNAVISEHENLLKLAVWTKSQPRLKQAAIGRLINLHWQKYRWLPCYDINDKPWTREYFMSELNKLLRKNIASLKLELSQLRKRFPYRQRMFKKILHELYPTPRQRELLIMAHEMSFIKDQRDDYRRLGSHNIQPLYHELARRAGVTIKEITHLIRKEMIAYLTQGKLPVDKTVLKTRVKAYGLLRKHGGEVVVMQGPELKKMIKQELGGQCIHETRILHGMAGSPGQVVGSAQVIYTKHDLRKIRQGDIMIAVTTHPDFVPAMRKCRAIVTDEGGITCHAAIVARELKKPCIVGTKTATSVLKDGDRVEVDAKLGVVKKIS
ncbi:MAG: PEP-utilizing enzyme [Patescibacteria group bacterium]|jgi:phosphohistidine swiveling domain-containing protein